MDVLAVFLTLFMLAIVGEPLRRVFSIGIKPLKTLDPFQVITFDVFMGGFIFYVLASIPLGWFTPVSVFLVFGFCSAVSFVSFIWKYSYQQKIEHNIVEKLREASKAKNKLLMGIALLLMFSVILWVEVDAANGIIIGNIHDASMFSMLSTVISQNGMIPATLSPFDTSGIVYPQGFTVILTLTSYVLNVGPANLILALTALFQALGIFGAYFLGKMWSGRMSVGLVFAFMFTFVSRWPKLLAWGSYAFVAAFPLFLIVLSLLLFQFKANDLSKRERILGLIFFGLIVGYLGAIHAVYYEVAMAAFFLLCAITIVRRRVKLTTGIKNFSVTFLSSLLPVGVSLYRYISSVSQPGQNTGLPLDISQVHLSSFSGNFGVLINNFLISDWISPYPVLLVLTIALIVITFVVLFCWRKGQLRELTDSTAVAVASLLGAGVVILLASEELGLRFLATAVNVPQIAIVLYMSLVLLMGIAVVALYDKIHSLIRPNLSVAASLIVVILIFFQSFSPFIYYTFSGDANYCRGTYNLLAVATPDDAELLLKIRNKLPEDSVILINPYDAGGFIPTLSGYKVIYPFTGSRESASYRRLCQLILSRNLNQTAYDLMQGFNITHVFVGSRAVYHNGVEYLGSNEWDPLLFLGNPNFKLIDQVNKSYLFAFTLQDPTTVLSEDFEFTSLPKNGWIMEASKRGRGTMNFSISTEYNHRFTGDRSLRISTQSYESSISVVWYYRMVYVPHNAGQVTVHLYLDTATGIQDSEGFTLIICNENYTRQLFLSSWIRGYAIRLFNSPGYYEINLSSLWHEKFSEPLPSNIFLQAEVYDINSQENIFYLDSVAVTFEAD